ncbi:protein kinase domain-containing protein [Candidatus Epulonipiscium viviparus]|uniref:protein kinase domain-containing protein n=1 Tax=Candidatus Epulonipiscium viviparus TaxID=420336 RepID=UPI0005C5DE74|nr:hypothetical protein [Candidatus Epulopiscium viviparus]
MNLGFSIQTLFSKKDIVVKEFLAEGGQGSVYKVLYNGEEKALKWYKKSALGNKAKAQLFYDNLKKNVERGTPSEDFLWPIDITHWHQDTFGYIMNLKPAEYYELTDFLLCTVRFRSYRRVTDAALNIVSAFRQLHNQGYSYQDLNDGNFFINPQNGKILICDNDNVAPNGEDTGIIGKPRYMAPEVVLGKTKPNNLSDRFSMSVILYALFCLNHPLEGKRHIVPALTPKIQEELYGSNPVFIMDPKNKSNGPDKIIHRNSLLIWPALPDYIKEIFLKAFSEKSFTKPSARPTEIEWLKVFTRFRSSIISCSCGNEIFANGGVAICEKCGRNAGVSFELNLGEYSIPALKGSRIYKCQISITDDNQALDPVALITQNPKSGKLFIENKSGHNWNAITSKGEPRKVATNEAVPLKEGIQLTINEQPIFINAKKGV